MGIKEGCVVGDCGVCIIVFGEVNNDGFVLYYRMVNSCIILMLVVYGK